MENPERKLEYFEVGAFESPVRNVTAVDFSKSLVKKHSMTECKSKGSYEIHLFRTSEESVSPRVVSPKH